MKSIATGPLSQRGLKRSTKPKVEKPEAVEGINPLKLGPADSLPEVFDKAHDAGHASARITELVRIVCNGAGPI